MAEKHAVSSELRQGWGLILACLLGIAFGATPFGAVYSISSFVRPLTAEFGWTGSQIQTTPMVVVAALIPTSFLVGWAADRVDVRKLIIVSQIGVALIFVALGTLTTNLTTFYILYFLMPVFGAGTILVTFTKLLSRSFFKHRGLAIGIALTGTGICGIVAPLYASTLIVHFGWRRAYEGLALLPLCVALPATLLFMRPQPPAKGGDITRSGRVEHEGLTLGAALRTWRYWAIVLAIALCAVASTGFITNMVPLFIDKGYAATEAAGLASLFGLTIIVGRIMVGWALDRFWAPAVAVMFFVPNAIALFLLTQGGLGTGVMVLSVLLIGIGTGSELDLAAYLCSRYFGVKHVASVYAGIFVMIGVGGSLAAKAFGWLHDATGSYDRALLYSGIALLISGGLLLTIGRYRYSVVAPPALRDAA